MDFTINAMRKELRPQLQLKIVMTSENDSMKLFCSHSLIEVRSFPRKIIAQSSRAYPEHLASDH